jgi:hypothetical protein
MRNSNTAALLQELHNCKDKLAAAKRRLLAKKKALNGSVMKDTPDLFGTRQSATEAKLFDVRVDPGKISAALAPIKAEIAAYEKDIDTLTYKIIQAENNTEPTLFDLAAE